MLGVNTDPYPNSVTYALANTMVWFWMGEYFIPGKTYYEPTGSTAAFNENYVKCLMVTSKKLKKTEKIKHLRSSEKRNSSPNKLHK